MYARTIAVFVKIPRYDSEIVFIPDDSRDRTVPMLKELAAKDRA